MSNFSVTSKNEFIVKQIILPTMDQLINMLVTASHSSATLKMMAAQINLKNHSLLKSFMMAGWVAPPPINSPMVVDSTTTNDASRYFSQLQNIRQQIQSGSAARHIAKATTVLNQVASHIANNNIPAANASVTAASNSVKQASKILSAGAASTPSATKNKFVIPAAIAAALIIAAKAGILTL